MHIIDPYRHGGGGGPGTTLVQDTFTDSDATNLESHTPDIGSAGTTVTGPWAVTGNEADCTGGGLPASPGYMHNWDCGQADVDYSVDYKPGSWSDTGLAGGIVLRYSASAHYILILLNLSFALYEWNGTSYTERGSDTVTGSGGNFYNIRAVCNGSTIDCYWNDEATPRITYTGATTNQTATKFGFRVNSDQTGPDNRNLTRWDNLLIVQV